MAENQVAVVAANKGSFPVATKDELSSFTFLGENALEIVRENLGGEPMSPNDFDRAKFPTGGGLSWAVPGIDGSDKPEATIEGIILLKKISRVFWAEDFSGAGARPDCQSSDLEYGVGAPGGLCVTCPYAKWGSAKNGDGQACKTVGVLFVMKPGEMLPIVVPVPVASVGTLRQFMLRLSSRNIRYHDVIVSLGLEQVQNKKGIKYSRIKPKVIAVLPAEAQAQIVKYINAFQKDMDRYDLAKGAIEKEDDAAF